MPSFTRPRPSQGASNTREDTLIGATIGLRVKPQQEDEGLDLADHGESAYND